jgi:hypothetical protein
MDEELQPTQEAENLEEELEQTIEGGSDDEPEAEDDVKQEAQDEYEVELSALQEKLVKKDEIIAHKNRAIESLKKRPNGSENLLGELQDRIKTIEDNAKQEIQQMKQVVLSDIVEDEIKRVSASESEQKLIRFHFDNNVKLNGYTRDAIRDAVSTAKLKANEKKIMSKMEEMSVALKAKATTNTLKDSSSVNVSEPKKQKLNEKERSLLRSFGIDA